MKVMMSLYQGSENSVSGKRESEGGGTHDTRFCYMGEPRFLKPESLMEVRESLRMPKQWEFADKIREDLGKAGVIVEDTPDGPKWQLNQ